MKSISLKQRRFLIVWICINAFALFVNVAHIKGVLQKERNNELVGKISTEQDYPSSDSIDKARQNITAEIDLLSHEKDIPYAQLDDFGLFCYGGDKNNYENSFYPFSTKFFYSFYPKCYYYYEIGSLKHRDIISQDKITGFLGVFNGYGYTEFIVYIILGFAIVFLPKMWNNK